MADAIHFIGLLKSPVSWAKVGRELVRALVREGAHVSAVSLKGYLYGDAFPLEPEVEEAVGRERREGWDLALEYPPNFARLNGKRRAGIVIYEADRLPAHWARPIARDIERVIVPSAFCRDAAAASGVPAERIAVAPFGVDTDVYTPTGEAERAATGRAFNFLTVGAPHVRKGLAEAVAAFVLAFQAGEDVGLVIKCPPLQGVGRRPWEYKDVAGLVPGERKGQIVIVEGALGEKEMARLYRGADAYIQASYGEAFGLAAVEAAACGRPVITTNWGAAGEIFDEGNAYLVQYGLVDAAEMCYDWRGSEMARMARPNVSHLAEMMRRAHADAGERARVAQAALAKARTLTWKESARKVIEALAG